MPHVAGREDAGNARLEQERLAVDPPAGWRLAAVDQRGAGLHEAARIAQDGSLQPVGARLLPDEDEDRRQLQLLLPIGVLDRDGRQVPVPADAGHVRVETRLDVGNGSDLVDQVLAHPRQLRGAHDEHDTLGEAR